MADPISPPVTPPQRAALGLSLGALAVLAPFAVALACSEQRTAELENAPRAVAEVRAPPPAAVPSGVDPMPTRLWVDPESPAQPVADALRARHPDDAALLDRLASLPTAVWLGGWVKDPRRSVATITEAAAKDGSVPTLVLYNIPHRDCGQYSAGGEADARSYRTWVGQVAAGLGKRPAIVVLEPDSLSLMDCLTDLGQDERIALLHDAVVALGKDPNVRVYLDGGHPQSLPVDEIATRLSLVGLAGTAGFALNVSNFVSTKKNVEFGEALSAKLGGAHYVVDTSRNGRGASGEWCNPFGRALGEEPSTHTGLLHADAFLWVKRPGESDGTCHGGPPAGQFWGGYALELARASWEPAFQSVADAEEGRKKGRH